jgi:hypothetical protein
MLFRLTLITALLFSLTANAAKFGERDKVNINGYTAYLNDRDDLEVLYAGGGGTGVWTYMAFYDAGDSTKWSVPAGKQFRVVGVYYQDTNQSRWGYGMIGWSHNEGTQTASEPADSVFQVPTAVGGQFYTDPAGSVGPAGEILYPESFIIPTGSYPFARHFDYGHYRIYGILEDA